jgi:ParB-like chromosome segregation protein Spo0J
VEIREIEIDQIKTDDWVRKHPGNLRTLAQSIEEHGELGAIVVTPDLRLGPGGRQLEALKLLGRRTVKVIVRELADPQRAQLADNALRAAYSSSDRVAIARRLFPEELEAASARQRSGKKVGESFPKGRALDNVAKLLGTSGKTLQKELAIFEAAEADPERYGDLPNWLAVQRVDRVYQKLRKRQRGMPVHENEHGHKVASLLEHDEPTILWNRREEINALAKRLNDALPGLSEDGQRQLLGEVIGMFCEVFWAWAKKEGMTAEQLKTKLCAAINAYPYEE